MIFHACRADGTQLGEFSEEDFQAKALKGELSSEDYYWHEGMADWKAISEYRVLAKTQRISFVPPMRSTMKIDMDTAAKPDFNPRASKTRNPLSRLLRRIKGKN